MANKLFSLFEDKLRAPQNLVASPPQNLTQIGQQVEDPIAILRAIQQFEIVKPKADYTDFANFVFFNSALDYFNITGEKILNQFPYDATSPDFQFFMNSLDDYQRYVVSVWPSCTGYLQFQPTNGFAYVHIDDVGKNDLIQPAFLSPGTGSLAVEFWAVPPPTLTGSNDAMVALQKVSGSDGYSVYFSGSNVVFTMASGANSNLVSIPVNPGTPSYFCFSYDLTSSPAIIRGFSGSAGSYPVLVTSLTSSIAGPISLGHVPFLIGSGSGAGHVVRPLTGSLDEIRVWNQPLVLSQITSSFNVAGVAQDDLIGLWRFNESGSLPIGEREIVVDQSGNKLNGLISNYYPSLRVSGSLIPFDDADLVLSLDEPVVAAYISEQQASGSLYDRNNDNAITRLMPEEFFLLEEFKNTTVLQNFLYVLGRYFDQLKVQIDQFAYILKNDYGKINQTPDELLEDIGRFFGWEFTGNFLNSSAIQYIVGRRVLSNLDHNRTLDKKLFEIKNEFWKRTLVELMHLYKTKGTRESVESILRVYGANKNFIRLKEYGYKPDAGIQTFRINAQKSAYCITFGSGSLQSYVLSEGFSGSAQTVESRLRFPTDTSSEMTASLQTGSLWTVTGSIFQQLTYARTDVQSLTGTLTYTGSEGSLTFGPAPIFDNRWYNVAVVHNQLSGSLVIDVRALDGDEVTYHATASAPATFSTSSVALSLQVGATGTQGSQVWMQEVRVWDEALAEQELQDHTLNFQSFGTEEVDGLPNLDLHWRLNENASSSAGGVIYNGIIDFSGHGVSGSGYSFPSLVSPYRKFLNDYNYIASPEYGWNEEKVRSIAASSIDPKEAFRDNPLVALEFNLVDALNEDISQILATMDGFNESIGSPVDMFRDSYPDLEVLRTNYFKRLQGHVNFRLFADMLEFFDRSFIDMVARLIPARATFLGDEFVVESHMLERPKVQWNYRRREQQFEPEGRIQIYIRT